MATPNLTDSSASQSSSRKRTRSRKKKIPRSSFQGKDETCFNEGTAAFWKNYQNASDWTKSQEIAYWRSRATALEFENNILRQHIMRLSLDNKLPPVRGFHHTISAAPDFPVNNFESTQQYNVICKSNVQRRKYPHKISESRQHSDLQSHKEENNESKLKFEVSEEMKDFLELHMRHKMEQEKKQVEDEKKRKEATQAAGEENAKLLSQPLNFAARTEELKVLYGNAAPMIHGMETAIQLTFRRHCEKSNARLWPNIPLRL